MYIYIYIHIYIYIERERDVSIEICVYIYIYMCWRLYKAVLYGLPQKICHTGAVISGGGGNKYGSPESMNPDPCSRFNSVLPILRLRRSETKEGAQPSIQFRRYKKQTCIRACMPRVSFSWGQLSGSLHVARTASREGEYYYYYYYY